ncbi:tRNA glutamyl-Q(34) synthetase GluQRS [Parvularcula lutaonensis]|uniref:tRNA glutamyl-Q(34) synthetase GluQRS n=1 Tax=Parvularcula lutaonensis TaxID=491923 RepID=A0ABV7ME75_9PROT|nr:tRNA glutamyl-Q(34) synthetase GluQRS [Parvularcula lutaonensis]GGY53020.1 tRNA glutamyl-Q(34) synthetase GluQRS [Parvularcula lutaonensis]
MPQETVTRFAPSPTGYLHLGHAYSLFLNHDSARKFGGVFRLRIEDIDQGRSRPEFEQAIFDDLKWLGVSWDGPVVRQSERFGIYQDAVADLAARGLVYRCFKTRAELSAIASAPHGPGAKEPLTAPLPPDEEEAMLAEGKAFAWRLNIRAAMDTLGRREIGATLSDETGAAEERSFDLAALDDAVMARKDFPTSYHLASVIDDAAQGVSLVWRGEDLADALPLHRLLQELLGLPAPVYRHHRLILGPDGKRLAKRDKAATLRSLREEGVSPDEIRRRLNVGAEPGRT